MYNVQRHKDRDPNRHNQTITQTLHLTTHDQEDEDEMLQQIYKEESVN